ncbi:MAG TPA: hypothetical protein ENK76_04605, partial [Campylobacterales bacterium]|nr:hypothetical protein [Campylobacterales bacterium]
LTPTLTPTPTPTQTPTPIPTATPPILDEAEADKVCLGDKVWNDLNQNGIQDQDESGIENVKVTLYANDCNTELNTTRTDEFGNYLFSNLEIGEYCVGFSNFSSEYKEYITTFKNEGQDDTKDSDVNRDTNKTDKFTLNAMENEECNISIDMGVYKKPVCGEIIAYDDIINANDSDQITQIDILNNDTGISEGQTIKFIPIIEGEDLWKSNTTIPDSVELLDTLTVKDEGVWSIENGIVKFVPYDSFNGKIPSPVYYTIISENCNATYASESTLSNVAQITIDTPCYCNKYESSIPIFNTLGIIIVIFLNSILVLFFTRKKVY